MDRKEFIKKSAIISAAAMTLPKFSGATVKGSDKIKIAIVGFGGRGSDALWNMFCADQNIELVAVGDAFSCSVERGKKFLESRIEKRFPGKFKDYWKVGDNVFVGLDAIDKVVKTNADVVVLATPPIFRTDHIQKCLENNKNIFAEKPICIDASQLRRVYEQLIPLANQKRLSVVCGTQMRYQSAIQEAVKRVQDGQIGEIISGQFLRYEPVYLTAATLINDVSANLKPDDVEYQLKNWLSFIWTSGDQFVEQYIHDLDIALWAMAVKNIWNTQLRATVIQILTFNTIGQMVKLLQQLAVRNILQQHTSQELFMEQRDVCICRLANSVSKVKSLGNLVIKSVLNWKLSTSSCCNRFATIRQ